MHLRRQSYVLFCAMTLAACHRDEPTIPPGAVIGKWGAPNIGFASTGISVAVQFPCGNPVRVAVPLIPDGEGAFTLPPFSPTNHQFVIEISGRISGDRLELDIITPGPADAPMTTHYTLIENQDPVFTLLCTASVT